MSFLDKIRSAFGDKKGLSEVSLEALALFPVMLLVEEKEPFSDWRSPTAVIPGALEEEIKVCVWMYQMWIFYAIVGKRFGHEIAEHVLHLQIEQLCQASEALGKQLELAIRQIQRNASRQMQEPHILETEGGRIEMPIEYAIALEFLVSGKDPLFPVDQDKLQHGEPPSFGDPPADMALAECLEHGKDIALPRFEALLENLKVVL